MRIMIKGGVWKNTEDEILKAAVMKYGKNQWARISSLLVRKSAKQCKARWYEWLDPSIKKTEWTREEDEKLLHLAKLMPTQWRTIAPIVGRTPAQCLERYEKLLDAASQRDEDYDPADDPRRLRPGEIDPNPESKPARPDAVDMDEDEKEMLSEARARLANTKGKKAKRKAREKQLEEARRLASLQKKRELKAAGIEQVKRAKRTKGIDYNAEIAFQRTPAPGFYDVGEERFAQPAAFDESTFKPTTMEEMEGQRRSDLEDQLRKQDVKRAQIAERHDTVGAVKVNASLNDADPNAVRRRAVLNLPKPRVSERELEDIAKLGKQGFGGGDFEQGVEDTPGGTLLGEYSRQQTLGAASLSATPARTPSVGGQEAILREAMKLKNLSRGQTPLLGGENPSLVGSDFSGITPAKRDAPTPNLIASISATPRAGKSASVSATPLRDALHINDRSFDESLFNARELKQRALSMRSELREGLSSLPAPANEYRIEVPDVPEDEEDEEYAMEEDLADTRARLKEQRRLEHSAALWRRSAVIRRDLPRPSVGATGTDGKDEDEASHLVAEELEALLKHDAARYPSRGDKKAQSNIPELPRVERDEMVAASELVNAEAELVKAEMGHSEADLEEYIAGFENVRNESVVLSDRSFVLKKSLKKDERISAVRAEHESLVEQMTASTKKATKLEHKVGLLTTGLQKRAEVLAKRLGEVSKELLVAQEEKVSYEWLHERELRSAPRRIETLLELTQAARQRESELQSKYATLQRR